MRTLSLAFIGFCGYHALASDGLHILSAGQSILFRPHQEHTALKAC